MGRFITELEIKHCSTLNFLVPKTHGTVHAICGENSVGKTYILKKIESLWRGVADDRFDLKTIKTDDELDGSLALYYGKIWRQKDKCGCCHISNTKPRSITPTDGPVNLFVSVLKFVYECVFASSGMDINDFSDIANGAGRLRLLQDLGIEINDNKIYPCPESHQLVQQIESIMDGCRLYYRIYHVDPDEIWFDFVLVNPYGHVSTPNNWSDGQKTVFYLLLNLYYQKLSLIIMDEVENHMHPGYISKVLEVIHNSGRQCILSTHNPHVIFSEYIDRVFYMELDEKGEFSNERLPIDNKQVTRVFKRNIYTLETDFDKITNTYKLFEERDNQLLKISKYFQNEVELKAYEIVSKIRLSNSPVNSSFSSLPDKQTNMLVPKLPSTNKMRILDIGAGYGRIKEELEKKIEDNYEWFLFNPDTDQHEKTLKRFEGCELVHAINRYDDVEDDSIDIVIVANVIHEITPPALCELLFEARKKLKASGKLYIIDMEPLLYAEHYAVPYSGTEVTNILNSNGWICSPDIVPHKFVTLYIISAIKAESGSVDVKTIENLWENKRINALAAYRTAETANMADYQKTMQAMTTTCSIDSYFKGLWK